MNKLPEVSNIAASVIPGRSPRVKLHASLAEAKKAVTCKGGYRSWTPEHGYLKEYRQHMQIYVINVGLWELKYEITPGMLSTELPWL